MKKTHLPTKVCPVCDRPFAWRKKWKAVWDEVKYCSKRCRSKRAQTTPNKPKRPQGQQQKQGQSAAERQG